MAQADDQIYTADDKSVGEMLHRLFEQGHDEVEIQHPLEGARVITRAEFYGLVDALEKSPAEKLVERKKIERLAKLKRKQFRKAMTRAKVHRVDLENDHVFGIDVEGNELDIGGMVFIQREQYLPGIDLVPGEVGCFYDDNNNKRTPIRIVAA